MNACPEGFDIVSQLHICGLDNKTFAQALVKNGHTEYAVWVRDTIKSYASIKFLGDYKVTKYMVFNPISGQYEYVATKEEVPALKARIIADYVAAHVIQLIDVQEEITDANGAVASGKIDL